MRPTFALKILPFTIDSIFSKSGCRMCNTSDNDIFMFSTPITTLGLECHNPEASVSYNGVIIENLQALLSHLPFFRQQAIYTE
jgi:hypothetical protein